MEQQSPRTEHLDNNNEEARKCLTYLRSTMSNKLGRITISNKKGGYDFLPAILLSVEIDALENHCKEREVSEIVQMIDAVEEEEKQAEERIGRCESMGAVHSNAPSYKRHVIRRGVLTWMKTILKMAHHRKTKAEGDIPKKR